MRQVFVDSSAFAATVLPDDPNRRRAEDGFRSAVRDGEVLVTTNVIIIETYSLLLARKGPVAANEFLASIEGPRACRIERVTAKDELDARRLVRERPERHWSLVDALSCVVMKRLHIRRALSFDRHFREFSEIIAEAPADYASMSVEAAWLEELERRLREVEAGSVKLQDWSVVRKKLLRQWTLRKPA